MNIFEFGMQMEKDGETYYHEIIKKTNDPEIKTILSMLAEDEVKHYEMLKNLNDDTDVQLSDTEVLSKAKNIFAEAREKNTEIKGDVSLKEMFETALELEKKSQLFYEEKAGEIESDAQKSILLKLAEEEKKHYFLIENLIEFLTRPETWVENAEFNHLDEY
jgi:rubrerythrin